MANYTLVANSTFQPFTYQELVAPIAHQQQVLDRLADEYDKLSSQADVLEAMGANDRDKDSKVYQQYKNYSDRLRTEADNLYRNGLNTESRMRLSELRRMYNTDIVPIQNAWQKREKEAELQMKAQLDASSKGIDLYFSRNAADTPLQSYLDNPNQTFRTINGQALMNEVAAQFKGLANQLQEGKIKKEQLSPIEYRIITNKGMDFNEYMDFINNPNAPEFRNIRGIINGTLTAHGAQDFDPTTQQRLFGLASQGVAAGVGSRDMQFHTQIDHLPTVHRFHADWLLQVYLHQQQPVIILPFRVSCHNAEYFSAKILLFSYNSIEKVKNLSEFFRPCPYRAPPDLMMQWYYRPVSSSNRPSQASSSSSTANSKSRSSP